MEQANETAFSAGKHEKSEHIGPTEIVAAEFEAGQGKMQVPPRLIDQIARVMTA